MSEPITIQVLNQLSDSIVLGSIGSANYLTEYQANELYYPLSGNPSGYSALSVSGVDLAGRYILTGIGGLVISLSGNNIITFSGGAGNGDGTSIDLFGYLTTGSADLRYYLITNPNNYINSGNTGNFISNWQTGKFYGIENINNYISSGSTGFLTGQFLNRNETGNFLGRWESGGFYSIANINQYSTSGDLYNTGSSLSNLVNNLSNLVVYRSGDQNISGIKRFYSQAEFPYGLVSDHLYSTSSAYIGINVGEIYDGIGKESINWQSRLLKNSAEIATLNWQLNIQYDSGNIESIDWENRNLLNNLGLVSVNWTNNILSGNWITNTNPIESGHLINKYNLDKTGESLLNYINNSECVSGELWVSMYGNDITARRNVKSLPFATIQQALNSAQTGDKINIGIGLFLAPVTGYKDYITFQGAKEPGYEFISGKIRELKGGTRIYGHNGWNITATDEFFKGIQICDLGLDGGETIRNLYFSGTVVEGFSTAAVNSSTFKGIAGAIHGLKVKNVTSLGPIIDRSGSHTWSLQNVAFGQFDNITSIHGHHGIAYKSEHCILNNIKCIDCQGDAIIAVCSDIETLPCSDTIFNNINIYSGNGIVVGGCGASNLTFNNIAMVGNASGGNVVEFLSQQNIYGTAKDNQRIIFNNIVSSGVPNGIVVSNASPVGTGVNGLSGYLSTKHCNVNNAYLYGCGTGVNIPTGYGLLCNENIDYYNCNIQNFYGGLAFFSGYSGEMNNLKLYNNTVGIYAFDGILLLSNTVKTQGNIYNTFGAGGIVSIPDYWQSTYGPYSVTNTTAESSLLSSATEQGSRTVLSKLFSNNIIKINSAGTCNTTGVANITFRAKAGTAGTSTVLTFPTISLTGAGDYSIELTHMVRPPAGSVCGLLSKGILFMGGQSFTVNNFSIVDATVNHIFDITAQWNIAGTGNTVNHNLANIEILPALRSN